MPSDSLAALRDIHLPPVPWLWTVPDWAIVAALALLVAATLGGWRYLRSPRLRAALRELAQIEAAYAQDGNANRLVRGVSRLLRRYAAACYPQDGIEGLTGSDWADFLVAHGRGFDAAAGQVLTVRPYQAHGDIDAALLLRQVRRWVRANPQ
ncbi:MAG TPA: DUF4381 domain-containing protein [Noviherbaspirillum sp.]